MAPPRRRPPSSARPKRTGGSATGESRGLGNVSNVLKQQELKRELSRAQWVKTSDDPEEPTVIRVYDIGLFREGYYHRLSFEIKVNDRNRKGRKVTKTIEKLHYCLDQNDEGKPCPGCKEKIDKQYKFWLPVIERDAPIVNSNGKIKGYKDRMALLSGGSRLAGVLNDIQTAKGLEGQDIELVKSGENFDTQYEGETLKKSSLSAEDKALIKAADTKKWIDRYDIHRDFDDFFDLDEDQEEDDDEEDRGERSIRRGSSFGPRGSKGRAKEDDEEEDDDDDQPVRRRRSSRSKAGTRKPGGGVLGNIGKSKSSGSTSAKKTSGGTGRRSTTRRRRPPR